MASRHIPTQRLMSGVLFSAPNNMQAMPTEGWGEDAPFDRPKKSRSNILGLTNTTPMGIDSYPTYEIAEPSISVARYDNPPPVTNYNCFAQYKNVSEAPQADSPKRPLERDTPGFTLCLPVLSVSLTATVDGTLAHTELIQRFHNPSKMIIDEAKHTFPLYDGAVITSFECTIGDERRIRGVVKPRAQARGEYEEAVRNRVKAPALIEEHTPEIFETSLGNIPATTTVEIKITYVQELKVVMMETEATEGISLTIPTSIAPRYSKSPPEWEPLSRVPDGKLDIWVRVIDNGKVNHEGCEEESGHIVQFEGSKPIEYSYGSEKDIAEDSAGTYYVWHHHSQSSTLRKDFVFVIQLREGHHIQSSAIACPADGQGLAAMMLSIRPNDLFRNAIIPQSFSGEILFLLDRSGSMGASNGPSGYNRLYRGDRKIDVMREAMLLALCDIPNTCIFNIISWGTATIGLWEHSRPHSEDNLNEAKSYVSQIEPDMGGTDLLRALEAVVKRRAQDRESAQIIVLTDGELQPEETIQFIWKKRQILGDSVRFFALGIGDNVSHRLVESIAECGGGFSDVVHTTKTPRWHDRLNRLVKSALEPNSWSCELDLGSEFEQRDLVNYRLGQEKPLNSGKIPYIQDHFPIPPLHPFSFNSICFLVDLKNGGKLPTKVTVSTTTPGAKSRSYELPIEIRRDDDRSIHSLVAKSTLLNLEAAVRRGTTETPIAKANAENIGKIYSITSKWTSFVAIFEQEPTQTLAEQKMNHYKALIDKMDIDKLLDSIDDDHERDSYRKSARESISESPGNRPDVDDPPNRKVAIECQNSQGVFELPDRARKTLRAPQSSFNNADFTKSPRNISEPIFRPDQPPHHRTSSHPESVRQTKMASNHYIMHQRDALGIGNRMSVNNGTPIDRRLSPLWNHDDTQGIAELEDQSAPTSAVSVNDFNLGHALGPQQHPDISFPVQRQHYYSATDVKSPAKASFDADRLTPQKHQQNGSGMYPDVTIDDVIIHRKNNRKRELLDGYKQFYNRMGRRYFVFIIDDSVTMRGRKREVLKVIEVLVWLVMKIDPAGPEIRFTSDPHKKYSKERQPQFFPKFVIQVRQWLSGNKAETLCNMKHSFIQIFADPNMDLRRPTSVIVLTDGVWDGGLIEGKGVETIITMITKWMEDKGLDDTAFTFQFLSFGNDPDGLRKLIYLNDHALFGRDEHNRIDIVDHKSSESNVWAILTGSVSPGNDETSADPSTGRQSFSQGE